VFLAASAIASSATGEGLNANTLRILYNLDDPNSRQIALYYAERRALPAANVVAKSQDNPAALPDQPASSEIL
jgi:hypothetical protein